MERRWQEFLAVKERLYYGPDLRYDQVYREVYQAVTSISDILLVSSGLSVNADYQIIGTNGNEVVDGLFYLTQNEKAFHNWTYSAKALAKVQANYAREEIEKLVFEQKNPQNSKAELHKYDNTCKWSVYHYLEESRNFLLRASNFLIAHAQNALPLGIILKNTYEIECFSHDISCIKLNVRDSIPHEETRITSPSDAVWGIDDTGVITESPGSEVLLEPVALAEKEFIFVPDKSFSYFVISYKSEEIESAREIKKYLEINGINCWMAPDSIGGGNIYPIEISIAIDGCDGLIVQLSSKSQKSKWVLREIIKADDSEKKIIPFCIDNSYQEKLAPGFDMFISPIQIIAAVENREKARDELLNRICQIQTDPLRNFVNFGW